MNDATEKCVCVLYLVFFCLLLVILLKAPYPFMIRVFDCANEYYIVKKYLALLKIKKELNSITSCHHFKIKLQIWVNV